MNTPLEAQHTPECECVVFGSAQFCKLHASAPTLLEALRNTQETIAEQHPGTMETCSCPLAERFRANEKAIRDAEGKI